MPPGLEALWGSAPASAVRDAQARAMSEDTLKGNCIDMAEALGWQVFSIRRSDQAKVQGHTGKGFPDLHMVRWPRSLYAELKRQTGRVTPDQQRWLDTLDPFKHLEVYVWRPSDWLDGTIEALLR